MNGSIANSLHQIMPGSIYVCTEVKGWMDDRAMQQWKENVWKPYLEGIMRSALIIDRMESHKHPDFIGTVEKLGTRAITITDGFTYVNQPYDVRILKPFKSRFTLLCQDWKVAEYARLGGISKIPA